MSENIVASTSRHEYRKFYGVLFGLFLAATLMSTLIKFDWTDWVRWFVGGLLLLFGAFKLIGLEEFIKIFPFYNLLAKKYSWYNYALPILEVALGAFYILNLTPLFCYVLTVVLMAIGLQGAYVGLLRCGPSVQATCLGKALKLPMSNVLLIESLIVLVLAAALVFSNLRG
jgi:hypothetical protein